MCSLLNIKIHIFARWMDGWMDGWIDGWMVACVRLACHPGGHVS